MEKGEKILALGASRGFGAAVVKQLPEFVESLAVSRKSKPLSLDFSKSESLEVLSKLISEFKPSRIFYFAGGGPFGRFEDKDWKDHQWALEVGFLFPSRLLYKVINEHKFVTQIVFTGSLIAEDEPHPMGASYGAAKSALKGLIGSVVKEKERSLDIRLFSPGYMDTELLPKNAYPRREGKPILSADFAAEKFLNWVNDKGGGWHLVLPSDRSAL